MTTEYREDARLRQVTREEMPADQQAAWDHICETRKLAYIPGLFAAMAHSAGAMASAASVGEHVRFHSVFDHDLRELIICHTAQELGNFYEWCHHMHRLPPELQEKVGTPAIEAEPAPVGPVMRFARLAANNQDVDDATVEAVRAAFGERGLVDLTVMVGYYQLVATFCRTMHVPIEEDLARPPFKR